MKQIQVLIVKKIPPIFKIYFKFLYITILQVHEHQLMGIQKERSRYVSCNPTENSILKASLGFEILLTILQLEHAISRAQRTRKDFVAGYLQTHGSKH